MKKGKALVQIREGDKLTQKIVETRDITIEEADKEIVKDYKEE